MIDFIAWPKIPRDNPFAVTITEKMDGTNACIVIEDGEIVAVQSRKRFITPDSDNYGFASWVLVNEKSLLELGDGRHYGEWVGLGIQKNPHMFPLKLFFLFNVDRWNDNHQPPACCNVVSVLFRGIIKEDTVTNLLEDMSANAERGERPEGVVVYYHAFRKRTKHTLRDSNGKGKRDANI